MTCKKRKAADEMPFLALLFLEESLLFAPISHSAFEVLQESNSADRNHVHLIPVRQMGHREACLWAKSRSWTEKSYDLVKWLQQVSTCPQKNKLWIEISSPSPYRPKKGHHDSDNT